jgi:ERCC4-type nuclease
MDDENQYLQIESDFSHGNQIRENLPNIRLKYVDSREPFTDIENIAKIRFKLLELGWNSVPLHSGDYAFQNYEYKWIGFTRKTISDLINSIGERFSYQLEVMLDYYAVCVIIIEGSWRNLTPQQVLTYDNKPSYQTWDMIMDYLHRFFVKGLVLELCPNEDTTIHRLNHLYALHQKPMSLSSRSKDFTDDRILAFPSGCRGKTAMSLLKGRSLTQVGQLTEEELRTYGLKVGEKKAQQIRIHFNNIKE